MATLIPSLGACVARMTSGERRVAGPAQSRTAFQKSNSRNSKLIRQTAFAIAADLLTTNDHDDTGIPLVKPISCGSRLAA